MFVAVKQRRKTKGEKVIENTMKEFREMQTKSEKRFGEWEKKVEKGLRIEGKAEEGRPRA